METLATDHQQDDSNAAAGSSMAELEDAGTAVLVSDRP